MSTAKSLLTLIERIPGVSIETRQSPYYFHQFPYPQSFRLKPLFGAVSLAIALAVGAASPVPGNAADFNFIGGNGGNGGESGSTYGIQVATNKGAHGDDGENGSSGSGGHGGDIAKNPTKNPENAHQNNANPGGAGTGTGGGGGGGGGTAGSGDGDHANGLGGDGGAGGSGSANLTAGTYGTITVQGGNGGQPGTVGTNGNHQSHGHNAGAGGGGGGGGATLNVAGTINANYLNITGGSGAGGAAPGQGGSGGKGGGTGIVDNATGAGGGGGGAAIVGAKGSYVVVSDTLSLTSHDAGVGFTTDGRLAARHIRLSKNAGELIFKVSSLEIGGSWDTDFSVTGSGFTASADALLLTGNKNFIINGTNPQTAQNANDGHITLGQLQIKNGELNDDNWHNLVDGGLKFTNNEIEILDKSTLTINISNADHEINSTRPITGTGSLIKNGSKTFTLNDNVSSYSGTTTINGGILALKAGASLSASEVTVNTGGVLDATQITSDVGSVAGLYGVGKVYVGDKVFTVAGNGNFGGAILDAGGIVNGTGGGLIKAGAADTTLTLFGVSSSYAGNTEIKSGKLVIAADGSIGSGTNTIGDGTTLGLTAGSTNFNKGWTLAGNSNIEVNTDTTTQASRAIMEGVLDGSGSLTKTGDGTLILTATNTYTGTTTINGGTLQLGNNDTTVSINTQNVTINEGATLAFGRSDAQASPYSFSNVIGGGGNVDLMGTGYVRLTGLNTYAGKTTISNGGLIIDSDDNIGSGTNTIGEYGTLVLTGSSYNTSWTLGGDGTIQLATINTANAVSFGGALTGSGGLAKIGAGTLTLASVNAYTGNTDIREGTLEYSFAMQEKDKSQVLSGDLTIASGASLVKSGTGTLVVGSINQGGTPGTPGSLNGNITINNGELYILNTAVPNNADKVVVMQGGNPYDASTPGQVFSLIGLNAQDGVTSLFVDSIDFSDGTPGQRWNGIDIRGVTTDGSGQFTADIVVANQPIRGFEEEDINNDGNRVVRALIDGQDIKDGTDYLRMDAVLNTAAGGVGNKIIVNGGLSWYTDPRLAHGNFTLKNATGSFTVNTVLTDQTVPPGTGWDGKSLHKMGPGTLILSQNNTYSGTTTIDGGTLQLGDGSSATGNLLDAGAGVIVNDGGTLAFNHAAGNNVSFAQTISGTGNVTKLGGSTLTLSADNSFSGKLTIGSGLLIVRGSLGHDSTTEKNNYTGDIEVHGVLQMSQAVEQTLSGDIYGNGGFAHYGPGTTILTGNNTWTGDTRVEQGTLIGNLPHYTELTIQDHDAVYIGSAIASDVAGSWSGSLADAPLQPVARYVSLLEGAGTVKSTTSLTAQYGNFSGVIDASNGDFYKTNSQVEGTSETLTLSGVNTYQGQTHLMQGTLALSGAGTLGDNILNLYQGVTLDVSQADNGIDRSGREVYLRAPTPGPQPVDGVHAEIITAAGKKVDFSNATLHFDMPLNFEPTATLLNVSGGGTVDVSNANIKLYAEGALLTGLVNGDYVTLIHSDTPLVGGATLDQTKVDISYGAMDYSFTLSNNAQGGAAAGDLYAYYGNKRPNEIAGSLTYGPAARGALLSEGFDQAVNLVDHWKYSTKGRFAPGPGETASGLSPFASSSLSSIKYKTGSEVKMVDFTVIGGLAWDSTLGNGDILAGVYVDTGRGYYDSYMDHTPTMSGSGDGDGETWYYGGGAFAKYTSAAHWYVEASARGGKAHVEYDGKDSMSYMNYSGDVPYWGAHIGAGIEYRFSDSGMFDFYLKGIWQEQGSDTITTSTTQELYVKKYSSERTRLGVRYIHDKTDDFRWWVGGAWDYEFDGKVEATIDQQNIDYQNDLKGSTGIGQLGFEWISGTGWNVEAGLSGMIGKRQGGGVNVLVTYRF